MTIQPQSPISHDSSPEYVFSQCLTPTRYEDYDDETWELAQQYNFVQGMKHYTNFSKLLRRLRALARDHGPVVVEQGFTAESLGGLPRYSDFSKLDVVVGGERQVVEVPT